VATEARPQSVFFQRKELAGQIRRRVFGNFVLKGDDIDPVLVIRERRRVGEQHARSRDDLVLSEEPKRDRIQRIVSDLMSAAEHEVSVSEFHDRCAASEAIGELIIARDHEDALAVLVQDVLDGRRVMPHIADQNMRR
jgi:hypothetical protein